MRIAQDEAASSVRIIRAPICVFMTHPLMFLQRHDGQCIKVKWGRKNILAATRWTRLMFWSLFRSDCGRAKKIHENFLSFFRQAATVDTNFLWKSLQAMMQRWSFFADGLSFFGDEDEIYESLDEVLVRIRTSIDSL